MLESYRAHVAERAALGIPPLPLSAKQTTELVELLKNPPAGEEKTLLELITYRVPAGVDTGNRLRLRGFVAKVGPYAQLTTLGMELFAELEETIAGGQP